MSGVSFPVTFELTANNNASDAMQSLIQVMHEGTGATQEAQQQFTALRQNVTMQTRAFSTLRMEWRADNEGLYAFSETMQSIGTIGNQVLSIFNSLMLAQIAYAETSQQLSQATSDVSIAQMQMNEMIATYGPTSSQAIAAIQQYIQAQNQLSSAQGQASEQQTQLNVLYLGTALSALVTVFGDVATQGEQLGQAAGQGFKELYSTAERYGTDVEDFLTGLWGSVQTDAMDVWNDIQSGWSAFWNDFVAVAPGFAGAAETGVKDILNGIITIINDFINGVNLLISGIAQVGSVFGIPNLPHLADIPYLAMGGIVTAPTLALLGEQGPEAVIPLGSGGGLGGAGGAGGTTIINQINVQGSIMSENELTQLIDRSLYTILQRLPTG